MKFLLVFVSCCSSAVADEDMIPESNDRRSETRALMVTSKRRCKRKKRAPNSNSSSVDSAEWKPSLTSISEDKAVVLEERTERVLKRRSNVYASDSRSPRRSFEDRRDNFTAIPTFSATPFMF